MKTGAAGPSVCWQDRLIQALSFCSKLVYYNVMKKITAIFLILLVIGTVSFATWQLFNGNLEAAFSVLPFLLITYFFVKPRH